MTYITLHNFANRNLGFDRIKGRDIVESKVIRQEDVRAPTFEEYTCEEDTDEMYAKAKAKIDQEEETASGMLDHNDTESDDMNDKIDVNKKLKDVIQEYTKQEMNQLHLRVGERLKQLLPPNDEGMANGVVTHDVIHGIIKKRRTGFYPVSHVTLIKDGIIPDAHSSQSTALSSQPTAHSSNSGQDNSDDVQVDKKVKKLSKAVKPSVEADDEIDVEEEHQLKQKKTIRKRLMSALKRSKNVVDKDNATPEDKYLKKKTNKKSLMSAIANSIIVKKMKGKKKDDAGDDKETVKEDTVTEHPVASTSDEDKIDTKSLRRANRNNMKEAPTTTHYGGPKIAWGENVNNNDGQQQQPKHSSNIVAKLPVDRQISNARKRRRERARQSAAL